MGEQHKWDDIVIKAIFAFKDFDIKEVNNFQSIQSLLFDREKYPAIITLIKDKNWGSLEKFEIKKKNGFGEYLDIIKFSDQNHKAYAAAVYDNDELWQDPEIIDIIALS